MGHARRNVRFGIQSDGQNNQIKIALHLFEVLIHIAKPDVH